MYLSGGVLPEYVCWSHLGESAIIVVLSECI